MFRWLFEVLFFAVIVIGLTALVKWLMSPDAPKRADYLKLLKRKEEKTERKEDKNGL